MDYDFLPQKIAKKSIKALFAAFNITASPECYDFLRRIMVFDPEKRLNVEEALKHPYMSSFHKEEEEYKCNRVIVMPLDDNKRYDVDQYRQKLYEEVMIRKIEIRNKLLESMNKQKINTNTQNTNTNTNFIS